MLMRSNPATHSISQLSIARDMRVDVPGTAAARSTRLLLGGPALAIRTVEQFTGVTINHVVVVNFYGFEHVIDAVGASTSTCAHHLFHLHRRRTVTFHRAGTT